MFCKGFRGSVLAFPFLASGWGPAASAAEQAGYLDELVVTGTRTERSVLETPVRTEVVTREEMEKTHARTVKEALENVPGLQLQEIHGKSGFEVWLQGINADRVLVLIDGLPVTATTGSSVDVSQLTLLEVERIEVVKGAVSAQYGSAAMGGVVNVITRPISPGIRGSLRVDGGSFGDQNPSGENPDLASYSGRAMAEAGGESLGARLVGSWQHSDGIDPEPSDWHRPGDEFDRGELASRFDWRPSANHMVSARASVFEESSGSRYTLRAPVQARQGRDEEVRRWRGSLRGEHELAAAVQGFWALMHEELENNTIKYSPKGRFDDRQADIGFSQISGHVQSPLGQNHSLQVGADIRRETLEQTKDGHPELERAGQFSRESYELWLQDTWLPSERWEWVTGIRAQHDSDFGGHFAPKINGRLQLLDSSDLGAFVRAGVGAGYRVPNLKERHFRFDHSQLGYVVKGNPDLEPEESVSYQLGFGVHQGRSLWFEANGFLNNIEKLIQTGLDEEATQARGDGVSVFRYQNLDEARTWGLETTVGARPATHWQLTAGYTFTRTEDLATGNDLNRRPEHQARVAVDGPGGIEGLSWSLRVRHQSSEFVDAALDKKSPAFTTADIKLNYQATQNLKLFGGVDNLTSTQRDFDDKDDFRPVAGRFVYAGIAVEFDSP